MKSFTRSPLLIEDNKWCPGCGHGILNRIIADVMRDLEIEETGICSLAVGCCGWMIDTFAMDCVQAQHGRAPAVAAGIKRCRPNNPVIAYQGDGDALAIGFAETMQIAMTGENITCIIINNGVFGMTGGQMAPTTLAGQRTTTTAKGRDTATTGQPTDIVKLLSQFNSVKYLARGSLHSPVEVRRTARYIRKALETQMNNVGYSLVEVLAPCPTNWHLQPLESLDRIKNDLVPMFPLGEFADSSATKAEHVKEIA